MLSQIKQLKLKLNSGIITNKILFYCKNYNQDNNFFGFLFYEKFIQHGELAQMVERSLSM